LIEQRLGRRQLHPRAQLRAAHLVETAPRPLHVLLRVTECDFRLCDARRRFVRLAPSGIARTSLVTRAPQRVIVLLLFVRNRSLSGRQPPCRILQRVAGRFGVLARPLARPRRRGGAPRTKRDTREEQSEKANSG